MSEMTGGTGVSRARPRFRNISVGQILQYRLPPAGIVSILHRVSGALMFLVGLPVMLYLLQQSLGSASSFESYRSFVSGGFAKLVLIVLTWAYLHHLCAGIRYLLLDLHIGTDKERSRASALASVAVSLALTAVFALKILGAF